MTEQKQAVADCMNRLYARGLTTTSGGNISLRISEDLILLTPSATDKGNMRADQIAGIGMDGSNHTPELKPSGETAMHLEIYKRRPDVHAIVHAHPPMASVFAVSECKLNVRLIAESYAILGEPVVAPYALTGTDELADLVAAGLAGDTTCVIMKNHGVLTVGHTLLEAFDRMEVLENAARINIFTQLLGEGQELNDAQCAALDAWAGRNG
jgi:L-fuculose-phosphate aldolase